MTNENIALLKKALFESTLQEIREIEAIGLPDFSISEEFKVKIYNSHIKKRASLSKRVIIAIVAAVITCTIIMMSISAIRNPIIDFIVETFDGFAVFSINDDAKGNSPKKIEVVHSPMQSMLERGYTLEYHSISATGVRYIFENKTKNRIDISQSIMNIDISGSVENYEYKETSINHISVHYVIEHNTYIIYWMYNGYIFNLTCDSSIDWEEIELIIRETIYSTPVPISEWGK